MKILVTGDFVIQNKSTSIDINNENDLHNVFHEIKELCTSCDYAITNLENPVTESSDKICKDGPHLKMAPRFMKTLTYCGFNVVTLANNHLKDYGSHGVIDTIKSCRIHNIQTVGAGININAAYKPLILKKNNLTIGIINVCESESSIATTEEAGAAPFDLITIFHTVKEIRSQCNYIIVIVHGGCENYPYPTPEMKRKYRFLADIGTDIVINHHQHCYSGYEIYNNVPIFYGIGNLFFDEHNNVEKWYYGLALVLNFGEKVEFEILPFKQCKNQLEVRFICSSADEMLHDINKVIADDALLKEMFKKHVESSLALSPFTPYNNHYIKALYHRHILPALISKQKAIDIKNRIQCESHYEVILEKLRQFIEKA